MGRGILAKNDGLQLHEVTVEGAKGAPALSPSPRACSEELQDSGINLSKLSGGSALPSGLMEAKYSQRVSHLGDIHCLHSQILPHSTCSM